MTIERTREVMKAISKVLNSRKAYQCKVDTMGRPLLMVEVDGEMWWFTATEVGNG